MIHNESSKSWLEAICTVRFDLEEGQVVEHIFPEDKLTEEELKVISNYAFPDSHAF